jgi:hypothetical protein
MSDRHHDFAWNQAKRLVCLIAPALLEAEQRDAHHEFYQELRRFLERYEALNTQEAARLYRPSRN